MNGGNSLTVSSSRISNTGVSQIREFRTSLRSNAFSNSLERDILSEKALEDLIDGVLILTEQKELLYANDCARRILRQLDREDTLTPVSDPVPDEIWYLCQTLIESRHLFPDQYWLIESQVFIDSSVIFNVRARWFKLEAREQSCIILSIRDHYQSIKDIAIEESQKYRLTSREKEIWLLHRANYTYKRIASELCITPNTVKKHMKNIYLKQKAIFMPQND